MTDRELLEFAAKAAGRVVEGFSTAKGLLLAQGDGVSAWWNPLTNDGDCSRLEAALEIDVRWGHDVYNTDGTSPIGVMCGDYHGILNAVEPYGADKQAARRLASTRVAAMMGEAKP